MFLNACPKAKFRRKKIIQTNSLIICACPNPVLLKLSRASGKCVNAKTALIKSGGVELLLWKKLIYILKDSYFPFAEERGYHKWALAHSSSCFLLNFCLIVMYYFNQFNHIANLYIERVVISL